jgi:hypothetical protein
MTLPFKSVETRGGIYINAGDDSSLHGLLDSTSLTDGSDHLGLPGLLMF